MYDHYIAIDWAQANMAVARLTKKNNEPSVFEDKSSISLLRDYLKSLKGSKILTIEETTGSLWLNTELSPFVDKIIVCDPTRNKFLSEGAKTDKIDAIKLVQLLKGNLLKEVFQPQKEYASLRQLVSYYEDVVKAGVRVKNQYSAIKRSRLGCLSIFPIEGDLSDVIEQYEVRKKEIENAFSIYAEIFPEIPHIQAIPGIGKINSAKVVAKVVDPNRFPNNGHFLSYCGLVKLDRMSGGKKYKQKNPRYCRALKAVFKTAALSAIQGKNSFSNYYKFLQREKNLPEFHARHAVARKIAVVTLKTLKAKKKYKEKHLWT